MSNSPNMLTITIDGIRTQVPEGTLVIEAARQVGVMVPHFCYHPKLAPDANCRMCLVEIEKIPKLQTSCSTRVAEGMVVRSSAPHVESARKWVLQLLLGNHPLDCPVCDQGGRCDLQDFSHEYTPTVSRFKELKRVFPKQYLGPVIETQMNRCVSCMRCVRYCDEVIDAQALAADGRGTLTQITHWAGNELECDMCGGCIQICPVGAITSRLSMYDYRPWMLKRAETICSYCGDGCQITVQRKDDQLIEVNSALGAGRNNGDLCARGYFGYHAAVNPDRVRHPLVRRADGSFAEVTWEEALDRVAREFTAIKAKHGADAIGGLITARCTNEDLYLFQKFMRVVIGTNQIDSSARYGYINGVRALRRVQGTHRWTVRYEDVARAEAIMLVGTNLNESNPITALHVKRAVKHAGAQLITLESLLPFRSTVSNVTTLARHHLTVKSGRFAAAILGLLKAAVESDLVHEDIAREAPEFVQTIRDNAARVSWQAIQEQCGLPQAEVEAAARTYAQAQRAVVLVGREVLRSLGGERMVTNLLDLQILTGHLRREGSGLGCLAEANNEQGAVEMGAVAEYFPGPADLHDEESQRTLTRAWGQAVPGGAPATLPDLLSRAKAGAIKSLFIVGENPVESLPGDAGVTGALDALEFLVCQELFLTETAKRAHVVFPACSAMEKDGTFTNTEGHVQSVRQSIEPLGESRPDWEMFSALSVLMEQPIEYGEVKEIFKEIRGVIPGYGLLGPASTPPKANENTVAQYVKTGFKEDIDRRYALDSLFAAPEGAMTLRLVQSLYHSGKYSTRAKGLMEIEGEGGLQINSREARRLGVEEGQAVRLANDGGQATVSVKLNDRVPDAVAWYPEHFDQSVRALFSLNGPAPAKAGVDPQTHVPVWKTAHVTVTK
ncbi:MAG: NADH-quinone oxidoreductase subunit NuoG [Nitrospira sp.]|nr:NADH-quinone oxidoreductase subunit NuoG [Nitrospira sp.]